MPAPGEIAAITALFVGLGYLAHRIEQQPMIGRVLGAALTAIIAAVLLVSIARGEFLRSTRNLDDSGICPMGQNC